MKYIFNSLVLYMYVLFCFIQEMKGCLLHIVCRKVIITEKGANFNGIHLKGHVKRPSTLPCNKFFM